MLGGEVEVGEEVEVGGELPVVEVDLQWKSRGEPQCVVLECVAVPAEVEVERPQRSEE